MSSPLERRVEFHTKEFGYTLSVEESANVDSDISVYSVDPQCGNDNIEWHDMAFSPNDMDVPNPPLSLLYDVSMAGYISDLYNEPISEFSPQSGQSSDSGIMKQVTAARYENVAFTEQHEPYLYDTESPIDPTRAIQDTNDATLDNFFSRPIKIAEYEWGTGSFLYQQFNPWTLYFENPRVINRIVNYNLLRCKLKVKLVINGSGFHFGRAICSYLPNDVYDSLSENLSAQTFDIIQASQQPHVYLNPTTSQGGEITCPFFQWENWINIPDEQWDTMGTMTLRSFDTLEHANGATDRCTVSIFAWAEDVEMAVLTSDEPAALTAQSGTEQDEANAKGVVSGPATAIANFAGGLAPIPRIGPFAKATEIGANAMADMAKLFGLSRPTHSTDPAPYKPSMVSSLASTTLPDGVQKLTIDDKQELSIDPRIAGIGGADPLNIREIAKRESYIGSIDWIEGTAPETHLGAMRVDPCIHRVSLRGGNTGYHFPACAVAAMPFEYWTGTLRFRFMISCSAFHKGRLKVVYEPNTLSSNEYNTNYTQIIDLADRTDFTVEVGNGQSRTLLHHNKPGVTPTTDLFTTTTTPLTKETYGNGTLSLYVVNELTSPTTAVQTVQILCFVSAGDDFEVFVPDDDFQNFVFKPQDGLEPQAGLQDMGEAINSEAMNAQEESAPQHEMADSLGPSIQAHDKLNLVYTGEKITSFRQLLKRYNLHSNLVYNDNAAIARIFAGRRSMFPFLRGNVSGAVHQRAGPFPYNFCNTVLLHWVTYAFSGWRGSIRWKLIPRGDFGEYSPLRMEVQRAHTAETEYDATTSGALFYGSVNQAAASVVKNDQINGEPDLVRPFTGHRGVAITNSMVNPNLEFEMPYYSPARFSPGKEESKTGLALLEEPWDYRIFARANTNFAVDAYCAAGEDYQCYFWTGLPVMYYEANSPAPV
ncbi:structural polyprotein [Cylindrotheca closterium RNA virus 02]|nr:structural polyprotein [Cylindrotheca closterium RNA virus 02]